MTLKQLRTKVFYETENCPDSYHFGCHACVRPDPACLAFRWNSFDRFAGAPLRQRRRTSSWYSVSPENWRSPRCPSGLAPRNSGDAEGGSLPASKLEDGLPALGFAVLVYDRRGSGQSSGDFASADFETLADDAIAGQRALAKIPRIDPNRIGFWGLSQGGWLAVLAAGRSTNSAFAVSVSAPLVTAEEQMQFATSNLLAVHGFSESDVHEMLEARKAWIGYLHRANQRALAADALRRVQSRPWFSFAYLPKASELPADPEHDSSRKKLDDDPMAAALKVKGPLLFLYGGTDPWIPVAKSVERMQSLMSQTHNIEYAVIANANHEMMFQSNEKMEIDQKTTDSNAPQAPAYFLHLGFWLSQHIQSKEIPSRKTRRASGTCQGGHGFVTTL
jgi:pimeloyl-ACP methyl ester carboxylesterase